MSKIPYENAIYVTYRAIIGDISTPYCIKVLSAVFIILRKSSLKITIATKCALYYTQNKKVYMQEEYLKGVTL